MALQKLPAVAGIDNFDWAGHEDSKAALFPGGLTAHFRKETWNAIVDKLASALSRAGFSFDPEACRITESYGPLTAENFNRVVAAMTLPAPLAWAWENREDFPGYVGRRAFETGDAVYAVYLWELVRRLNLLLDILKSQAPFGELAGGEDIKSPVFAVGRSCPAAPAAAETMAQSLEFARLLARHLAALEGAAQSVSPCRGRMAVPGATPARALAVSRPAENALLRGPLGMALTGSAGSVSDSRGSLWGAAGLGLSGVGAGVSKSCGSLSVGWLAPVRRGGLWLRQIHGAVRNENRLEVL